MDLSPATNAVYPFNQLTEEAVKKTEGLLRDAQELGARALVCPLNDGTIVPPEVTVEAQNDWSDLLPGMIFIGAG